MELSDEPQVNMQVTEVTVSILPEDDINFRHYAIKVKRRGPEWWAITCGADCFGADGQLVYDRAPEEGYEEWLASHRFPEDVALRVACEAAPTVEWNGVTALEVWRKTIGRKPESDDE